MYLMTRLPAYVLTTLTIVFSASAVSDVLAQPLPEPFPAGNESVELNGNEAGNIDEPTPADGDGSPLTDLPDADQGATRRSGSHWLGRNKFIRSHWVRLSPSGELKGNISLLQAEGGTTAAPSLTVSVYRKGEKVNEAVTDANGGFVIPNMTSGVYASDRSRREAASPRTGSTQSLL